MEIDNILENKINLKLVAIDMDGTSLNSNHNLSNNTITSIKKLNKNGVMVLFATGRMPSAVTKHLREAGLSGLIVSHNGALVLDIYNNNIYINNKVNHLIVSETIKFYNTYKPILHINIINKVIIEKYSELSNIFSKELNIRFELIDSFFNITEDPTSLLLIDCKNKLNDFIKYMNKRYTNLFNYELIPWIKDQWMLHILPYNTSKGKAVIDIAKYFKIDKQQILSFGDSYNDIEMIKQSGIGIAMGNACIELKNIADYITKSNDEDGVAYILNKIF